jgi:hypothetical protein
MDASNFITHKSPRLSVLERIAWLAGKTCGRLGFHGDYSRPDTCILIYYENGKPSRFSEGKPYVFKMPEDSMLYHNTQYELLMTGRGWYDEEGNKYYYPPVR